MARAKGSLKTGGRQKGTPNRVTGTLKEMILQALGEVGGVSYLVKQARENPAPFLTLVGKALPSQVNAQITDIRQLSEEQLIALLEGLEEEPLPTVGASSRARA